MHPINHAPTLIVNPSQAVEVIAADALSHLQPISELCDFSDAKIFIGRYRLSTHVNHLVEEQRPPATTDILCHPLNSLKVSRPHVLASVHPESTHSNVYHVVVIPGDLFSPATTDILCHPLNSLKVSR